jgi:hypothetical protein
MSTAAAPAATSPRYKVVLRGDLKPPDLELLGPFGSAVKTHDNGEMLQLLCSEIDLSHGYFLQMQVIKAQEERTCPLTIPHHFVVLILGSDEDRPIGFLADSA